MKIKRFSKEDRESSEREFLRGRSKKNDRISDLVRYPATLAGYGGGTGVLDYVTRTRKDTIGRTLGIIGAGLASGVAIGNLSGDFTKLSLDHRDYLKAKRLTDEELKKEIDKLRKKDSKTK